jgi:tetratricopeptide (TPR) repeat protein
VITHRAARWLLCGLLVLAARPLAGRAFANVEVGDPVEESELPTLDGTRHPLVAKGAKASVVIFFRPGQDHSEDTLRQLAALEREFAANPVRWVAVVSDSWPADEVRRFVAATGVKMPVLVDVGDALYGRLGVRLHPSIGIVDAKGRLVAYEPFRQINYAERVAGRIRMALGELTEAGFAAIDAPPRAVTRTEEGVARRHVSYARSLLRLEQHEKALAECDRSLAVLPTAAAHALRGRILAALARCPDALRAFDAAQRLDPTNAEADEGRKACAP